eukprot:1344233-Amphidinium_carterae.1
MMLQNGRYAYPMLGLHDCAQHVATLWGHQQATSHQRVGADPRRIDIGTLVSGLYSNGYMLDSAIRQRNRLAIGLLPLALNNHKTMATQTASILTNSLSVDKIH